MPSTIPGVPYASPPRAQSKAAALAWPPRLVVIHDTGNPTATRQQEASYAANRTDPPSTWTSAHFYVDAGGPLGSLRLNFQAWAAYSYANAHGIHIEMCGMNAGDPRAVPAQTIAITAQLVRQLCALAGIPAVKLAPAQVAAGARGVCGHRDITIGLGVGDHDDPGAKFNWVAFMQQVNSGTPAEGADVALTADERAVLDRIDHRVTSMMYDTATNEWGDGGEENKLHTRLVAIETAVVPPVFHGNELTAAQLQAAVVAALQSPEGKAAIVAAVNVAEDS